MDTFSLILTVVIILIYKALGINPMYDPFT
jgi:hypothetical protein